jgi:MoxR-like ATPase
VARTARAWHSGGVSTGPFPVVPVTDAPSGTANTVDRDMAAVREMAEARRAILAEIGKRIVGQEVVIDHLLISLFARGHCLFVGVPGLAKTLLIQTLSEVLALTFGRIQFTPDLMPSDITGTDVLEEDRATGRRVFAAVDAGAPRVGGRADLRAAAALPRVRDAKSD